MPALLSQIKKQNFNDELEIIVADAGSSDKTVEIAESFGCKVIKGGITAKGRNEGAKIAKGDILLFTDADNIYFPYNFLNNLLEEFKRRKLGIASFPIYPASTLNPFSPDSNETKKNGSGVYPKESFFDKVTYGIYNNWAWLFQRFSAYATNSVLVRKDIHQKIGGFDEEIKLAEDHFYAKRGKKLGKYGFIKTAPVLTSARRLKKEGSLKTYFKYLIAGIYMFLFGPIKKDIFRYRVGAANKVEDEDELEK